MPLRKNWGSSCWSFGLGLGDKYYCKIKVVTIFNMLSQTQAFLYTGTRITVSHSQMVIILTILHEECLRTVED